MPGKHNNGYSYNWAERDFDEPVIHLRGEVPLKIQAMIAHNTEVSALGICTGNTLNVTDLLIPKQNCSVGHTEMDDEDVANETVRLAVEEKIEPLFCNRIWIHTHPGNSPSPSGKDWETFSHLVDCGGWAVMLIFAKDSSYFCRLGYKMGDRKQMVEVPVRMNLSYWTHTDTKEEIQRKVSTPKWELPKTLRNHKNRRWNRETQQMEDLPEVLTQEKHFTDGMYDMEYYQ